MTAEENLKEIDTVVYRELVQDFMGNKETFSDLRLHFVRYIDFRKSVPGYTYTDMTRIELACWEAWDRAVEDSNISN